MSDNILFGKFVELDNQCRELLGDFYGWMKAPQGADLEEQEASDLAHAADRYLRDFVVDIKELPPTKSDISTVRQYLGNWYPINTLEPSHEEVDTIAKALALFYRWAKSGDILDGDISDGVIELLSDPKIFHDRLETFWELKPEGVQQWRSKDDYR